MTLNNPERVKQAADSYRVNIALAIKCGTGVATSQEEAKVFGLLCSDYIKTAASYASEVIMWGGTLDDLKQENTTNG